MGIYYKKGGVWVDALLPPPPPPIDEGTFGVRIKITDPDPNKAVEYIDDATGFTPMTKSSPGSWATVKFVREIKPVLRKSNGQWQDLDKRNLAKGADIATIGNDAFTRFPTWWLSITTDGTYNYVRFCDKKKDNTYFDLASFYKGSRKGMFHVGCWHAHNSGNKLYSSVNKTPGVNITVEELRQYSQARGAGFDQIGYYQWMYLQALFLVLFKGRDAKSLLGEGCVKAGSIVSENRTTYDNDYGMAGSKSKTDQVSFFWVNNWWGNVLDIIGGAKTSSNFKLMTQIDGNPIVSTSSDIGYKTHPTSFSQYSTGYIKEMDCSSTEIGFFPKAFGGDYIQNWSANANLVGSRFLNSGGYYDETQYSPFRMNFGFIAQNKNPHLGTRLVYREAVN